MSEKMERFSQRARRVLALAQEEAVRLQHNHVGTEHLLLGLMRQEDGAAAYVLRNLELDQPRVQQLVESMTRAGKYDPNTRLDLTPRAKKVVKLAIDEARRKGHDDIDTEHLLLGLVYQNEGIAIDVLKQLGVAPEDIPRQMNNTLQEKPAWPDRPSARTIDPEVTPLRPLKNVAPRPSKTQSIFISYRQEDKATITGQICEQLAAHFSKDKIIRGTNLVLIPLGADISEYVKDVINKCSVVLVIIGSEWLTSADTSGRRRLDDALDLVRIEVEAALSSKLPVIPLLVEGVAMPPVEELPPSLAKLPYRKGMTIRPDLDFNQDMQRLIFGLEQHFLLSK